MRVCVCLHNRLSLSFVSGLVVSAPRNCKLSSFDLERCWWSVSASASRESKCRTYLLLEPSCPASLSLCPLLPLTVSLHGTGALRFPLLNYKDTSAAHQPQGVG